jgi:hypothetical protein
MRSGRRRRGASPVRPDDTIVVTCVRRGWALRDCTAFEWLMAVNSDPERLSRIFPGMIRPKDVEAMVAAMEAFDDMDRRWLNVARKALQYASGRDWWRAYNLMRTCLDEWTFINGVLLTKGCDARRMPLSSWLDAAYVTKAKTFDENGFKAFEMRLNQVPAGAQGGGAAQRQALMAFAAD